MGRSEILEPGERFQTWEHEKTDKKDGGRVYISVSQRGEVEIHEGYLTAKEAKQKRKAAEAGTEGETGAEGKPSRPEIYKRHAELS